MIIINGNGKRNSRRIEKAENFTIVPIGNL